jgi:hypothetical protein
MLFLEFNFKLYIKLIYIFYYIEGIFKLFNYILIEVLAQILLKMPMFYCL